ncbi:hypothetical protein [uncultured Limimaricola sp.]|uniref:hypothetical protein n=1 Tax=uncultured Limimaricola sp. TaxID=2211667 RepID=UPI0030F799F4
MSHRWMFDVLTDLEAYARHNGLPQLARKLSEAAGQAVHEMATVPVTERVERQPPVQSRAE